MQLVYSYSRPTTDSILKLLDENFTGFRFDECKFYVRGLHDNFLLKVQSPQNNVKKYILRLYRTQWRSEEEIRFELDVLSFLGGKGLNVSAPILNDHSEYLLEYAAPEGKRYATLFSYAEGEAPELSLDMEQAALLGQSLGRSVANLHLALDDFEPKYTRVELNNSELIDNSIGYISKYVDSSQLSYLKKVGENIKESLSELTKKNANYGVVTGDINFSNFHINKQNQITHFDFDQCGYAYRAFELGKFASFIASWKKKNKKELFNAFVKGYSELITLSDAEIKAIPYFEMASVIWVMGIAAQNESLVGYKYLEDKFWKERIGRLEALDDSHNTR